eukprot:TRINITY_DN27712_c0_g1_i1.p1 TRINITY_DN27712_c0_g1~~TRINITY_DN27712_c0_g1_i1.p1  ORF type:complete len:580 (-),score=226.98 TRINITY_DN27712_c0_g1_i1:49-1788(-)
MSEESTQALALDFFDAAPSAEVDSVAKPERPWGRLVSLNPLFGSFDLVAAECTLGRAKSATLQVKHGMVSMQHCTISKHCDDDFEVVFIQDTSSNGTFVAGSRVPSGSRKLLNDGDEISLLPPSGDPAKRVAYLFRLLCRPGTSGDLAGLSDKYDVREVLGTGNFATVRLAIEKASGQRYAVKVIDKKKYAKQAGGRKDALMDEVRILQSISHANIIGIHDVVDTATTLYIVLELVTGGELLDRINDEHGFAEETARPLFVQLLDAVGYLHGRDIVHRDLKPENILFETKQYAQLKLSDFGLSRVAGEGSFMQTMCGTPQYLAPEVIGGSGLGEGANGGGRGYGKAVDMWSLGAILYVMLSAEPPFDESSAVPIFSQIQRGCIRFDSDAWHSVSDAAQDLVRGLMTVDASKRLTAEQVYAHPWLTGDDFEAYAERRQLMQQPRAEQPATTAYLPQQQQQQQLTEQVRLEHEQRERIAEQQIEKKAKEHAEKLKAEADLKRKNADDAVGSSPTKAFKSAEPPPTTVAAVSSGALSSNKPPNSKSGSTAAALPVCKYHPNCYRKAPAHFLEYSHPGRDSTT